MSLAPGRALALVYAIFALAAGARSAVQVATGFGAAPLPYLLSALAAAVYLVAALTLGRPGRRAFVAATAACGVELAGVLAVGALSAADPGAFPDETVWSGFGSGYGYVPLVLPVAGLAWLRARGVAGRQTTASTTRVSGQYEHRFAYASRRRETNPGRGK